MTTLFWLIEDNEDDIALAQHALKKSQLDVSLLISRDGEQAVSVLNDPQQFSRTPPGLILLDLRLPKVGGLEVLEQIRLNEKTKLTPVTVLTTSDEESDINSSYTRGANSFIRKPVDFDVFVNSMRQLGQYWLNLNTPPRG